MSDHDKMLEFLCLQCIRERDVFTITLFEKKFSIGLEKSPISAFWSLCHLYKYSLAEC